ncbi:TonB family protein [Mucilaginibacter sp. AW1-3]
MKHRFIIITVLLLGCIGRVDAQPRFKGGDNDLRYFLRDNLVYPEYSRQNCISGTIQVSFNLDQAGKVHNVKIYKGMGIDLDEEAIRVLKLTSGKWIVPDDNDSTANLVIPITFSADDTRCRESGNTDMGAAIEAYKAREALVDAVTNYYANKYLGKADTTKEDQIIALKEQLGFDDDFADRIVKQANRKLKEGDNEGACEDWLFVRNIGSTKADLMLAKYCH